MTEAGTRCRLCGCRFAVLYLPRIRPVYPIEPEPDEYDEVQNREKP